MLGEWRSKAEVVRIDAALGRTADDVRTLRRELADLSAKMLADRNSLELALARLGKRQDEIGASQAVFGQWGEGLKRVADELHVLSNQPWRNDIEQLDRKLADLENRVGEVSSPKRPGRPNPQGPGARRAHPQGSETPE
jgi:hypothetical protein